MKRQQRFYKDGDLFWRQKYAITDSGYLQSVKNTRVMIVFQNKA